MPVAVSIILGIADVLDQCSLLGAEGKPVLVVGGRDGASVDVAEQGGMRGMMHLWLVWAWCYAHHLELASKNVLTSKLFKDIEEMLLHLYYLYVKSPKKTQELGEIVQHLKEVFELPKSGNIPVLSQGSRWITHRQKTLKHVVGVSISHLTALAEDTSPKAEDRACLKGYLRIWRQSDHSWLCTLRRHPQATSLLTLSLQESELDTVLGIENILKLTAALKSLSSQNPLLL